MHPYIYTAEYSAHFRHGQRVYAGQSGSRGRVWASLRSDGSDGCYVFACDLATPEQWAETRQRRADLRADMVR